MPIIRADSSPPSEGMQVCIICRQEYEPHPDALDLAMAAMMRETLDNLDKIEDPGLRALMSKATIPVDDGFCEHCRFLINATPEQLAEIRSAKDDAADPSGAP